MKNYKLLLTGLALVAGFFLFGATTNSFATGLMVWGKPPANIHEFTGLPLDINGWTDFRYMIKEQNLYQDARVVFVSSSEGNDATGSIYSVDDLVFNENGVFQSAGPVNPYQTLAGGAKQLRDGYPDIMLLKRGDEWVETLPVGNRSGRSVTERAIYSSYGNNSARPVLRPVGNIMSTMRASYLIFANLHFYAAHKDPGHSNYQSSEQSGSEIRWVGGGHDILVEDVHSDYIGWVVQGWSNDDKPAEFHNVAFRRCFTEKNYILPGGPHAQGIWTSYVYGLLLEDSTWYQNGWRADIPETATTFNRNLYLSHTNEGVVFRNNFSIMSATSGIQMRSGGDAFGNVISHCTSGIQQGVNHEARPAGLIANSAYNVILAMRYGTSGNHSVDAYGHGFRYNSVSEGYALENIVANSLYPKVGFYADDHDPNDGAYSMFRNFDFEKNIVYNHGRESIYLAEIGSNTLSNIKLIDNELENQVDDSVLIRSTAPMSAISMSKGNKYWSNRVDYKWLTSGATTMTLAEWGDTLDPKDTTSVADNPNYSDPDRSLATYAASLGYDETLEAFVDELRKQQRPNWRDEFTARAAINYIRAGFGRGPIPEDY
ncbi:hypothetical protein ACHHRT_09010 [Desulfurivibrio sp. D14AmB]|uniref:hypothetical protein n=1 Tax=Desulfurivibrio sp. D14AmB TaxID=3374370 RepID=UPI00376F17AD